MKETRNIWGMKYFTFYLIFGFVFVQDLFVSNDSGTRVFNAENSGLIVADGRDTRIVFR
jgi:hypothetical protein